MSETSAISAGETPRHKRQAEFHAIFKSIPDGEVLLESYACALSRDILIQGRLFVGEEHVCFYANILGWITSVVIAYRDIVSIDKRNTAVIFPNAIQVATLHHRYFFASFVYREEAYKQLQAAWRQIILGADPGRDFEFDEDVDMIGDDFIVEATADTPLDTTFESPSAGATPTQCGCDFHFTVEGLSAIIPMPLSTLHSALLDPRSKFLLNFYQSFSMLDCEVGEWNNQLSGGEQRIIKMRMPLPRILADVGHSMTVTVDKFLLSQPTRRFIIESVTEILNVPGGVCRVMSRTCMTALDQEQSHIFISFDAFPSKGAFFKESVRISLIIHFSELYTALGVALAEYSKNENFQAFPQRSLSWFRRRRLDRSAMMRRISSASSFESYFDFAAFVRSLFWIFILLALLSLILYDRLYRNNRSLREGDEEHRAQLIRSVQVQLMKFLESFEGQGRLSEVDSLNRTFMDKSKQ